jgi:putative transposase
LVRPGQQFTGRWARIRQHERPAPGPEVILFYAFPGEVRRILYTTGAIDALNAKLRRART